MKILISSCLIGENVKYNGSNNHIDLSLLENFDLIAVCPEVDGGLLTPRSPSEIIDDKVLNIERKDVTSEFLNGANIALETANKHNIKIAILKSNSPSCSNRYIYDGTFSKKLIKGSGVTTKLLEKNGIKVFNENQLDEAIEAILEI